MPAGRTSGMMPSAVRAFVIAALTTMILSFSIILEAWEIDLSDKF